MGKVEKVHLNDIGIITGETEKAIKVQITTERRNGDEITEEVWFPKFRAKNNMVSKKLADEKISEVKNTIKPDDLMDIGEVVRETDKAVLVNIFFECPHTDQEITRGAWFPKSMLKDGSAPVWMIEKKVAEAKETVNASHDIIVSVGKYWSCL